MKEMLGGCCVCSDENGWTDNPLIYCDGPDCEVAVHQGCYGIQEVPEGEWFCAKCTATSSCIATNGGVPTNGKPNGKIPVRCELCPSSYGALKRTEKHGWAHVICALYIPEVRFGDVHSMDPVILADVPADRFEKTCYICAAEGNNDAANIGACMSCNKTGCKRGFHVTCAQQRGLLCEEGGVNRNVKYCGYCEHHVRKAALDPSIKVIPPCRVRGHQQQPTPPSSNNSGHMLVDLLPRPEQVNTVLGLSSQPTVAASDEPTSVFSPPLTTSSRSSVALDATPPAVQAKSESGQPSTTTQSQTSLQQQQQQQPNITVQQHILNNSTFDMLHNNKLNALVSAAMGQSNQLTNHNRIAALAGATNGAGFEEKTVKAVLTGQAGTLPSSLKSVKRQREAMIKDLAGVDKPVAPKRPRPNNRKNNNTMKTLLGLVAPVVSETVDGFQRDRVADRNAARAAAATTGPSTSHELPVGVAQPNNNSINPGVGPNHYSPAANNQQMVGGPSNQNGPSSSRLHSTLPSSMEALLERQWEQGSQFLMSQAQFDVAQLLSCLHQLKSENMRLEEQLLQLTRRREHLVALNQRLSVPLSNASLQGVAHQQNAPPHSGQQQIPVAQVQPTTSMSHQSNAGPSGGIVSPHHSPHIPTSSTDELLQMRSLATGRNAAAILAAAQQQQRPPSAAPPPHSVSHSNANSSFTPVSSTSSAFMNRPSASASSSLSNAQPQPAASSLPADLSPERLAQLNQQLLFNRPNQLLSGLTANGGMDTANLLMLLQNQIYNNTTSALNQSASSLSASNLLARMMMNPLGAVGGGGAPSSSAGNPAAPLGGK